MGNPKQLMIQDNGIARKARAGDVLTDLRSPSNLTTAGAGTILAALMATGLLMRTGPGAAFNDTLDTAANIDTEFPDLEIGESISFTYSVNVGFAGTIVVAAGITAVSAAANLVVAANDTKTIKLVKTGVAAYDLYVL